MKTILVDDEIWSMKAFKNECESNDLFDIVGIFINSEDALEFARCNDVEFALLDIEMPGMNGIELSQKLREINPEMVVIFVTAYSKYALDALHKKADYFITKPYSAEDVVDALERARLLSQRQKKRIVLRTFGKFDVFSDSRAVSFPSKKAKELLALLVDRNGGIVTNQEALFTVWDDEGYSDDRMSLCRKAYEKLFSILERNGISNLVIKTENGKAINKEICDCDYFRFLDGDKKAIDEFSDIYLEEFSWGEETLAKLYQMKHKDET